MKRVKREGWRRGGTSRALFSKAPRGESLQQARRGSTSRRTSKQTLANRATTTSRGGETAIEARANRPEYACASDGGGVGGYRGLQRCSESWSSPPVHPRHLATRRRGQRRRGEPQAAWRGMRHFDAKPSVPWEPFIPHCGGSKRTGSRANRGRGSRSWHRKKTADEGLQAN